MYDLSDPVKIWTHAKAFSKTKGIEFSIADADEQKVKKIVGKYNVIVLKLSDETDFREYDIVSLTTPTPTHFSYLKKLMEQNIPLIICEKPVAANNKELLELSKLYRKSKSKILVNYIRRFQPAYHKLKKRIALISRKNSCKGINIKYQRGILNNGSHAFDLLEFLFDKPFLFDGFKVQKKIFDAFKYDPTVSGSCNFAGCPVTILGITEAAYPQFEIELFYPDEKIVICHSGDEIRFYKPGKTDKALVEIKKLRQSNILSQYMLPVVGQGLRLLANKKEPDNFQQSVALNSRIVKLFEK
ncbi:MAG: Gfo/Idh/MocA family oxidoreductase [Bacteroidetes bacterium]|nr:MAG: Gfo/Idh/MocA family oxidoreductase [Bacteroidota bacterium]